MNANMPGKAPQMRPNASGTNYPTPTPDTPLKGRICACGCGQVFDARRWWQVFKDNAHRKTAFRTRHRVISILDDHEARIRALEEARNPKRGD